MDAYFADVERINNACLGVINCETRLHGRCRLAEAFRLPPARQRLSPNITLGEGPSAYGLQNPGCQDCNGCNSHYTLCELNSTAIPIPETCRVNSYSGGYFSVEFARDVELQPPQYKTTQENVMAFLKQQQEQFNSEDPLPICLMSMGLHDLSVMGMTVARFGQNVLWFLRLLGTQCSHIMWLPNATPLQVKNGRFPQSEEKTGQFNEYIAKVTLPAFRQLTTNVSVSILDVWDASIGWPHMDNVHMDVDWYLALGRFLIELFENLMLNQTQLP